MITMYIKIAKMETIPLENKAVLPDSFPLAISLVVQYEIVDSIMITYAIKLPMSDHVPSSIAVNCLVTIKVKIIPVTTLTSPVTKEIRPAYVTLIPLISLFEVKLYDLMLKLPTYTLIE